MNKLFTPSALCFFLFEWSVRRSVLVTAGTTTTLFDRRQTLSAKVESVYSCLHVYTWKCWTTSMVVCWKQAQTGARSTRSWIMTSCFVIFSVLIYMSHIKCKWLCRVTNSRKYGQLYFLTARPSNYPTLLFFAYSPLVGTVGNKEAKFGEGENKFDALEGSYASPRHTLIMIRTANIPSLACSFAVTPCSYPDVDKWDAMIGSVIS